MGHRPNAGTARGSTTPVTGLVGAGGRDVYSEVERGGGEEDRRIRGARARGCAGTASASRDRPVFPPPAIRVTLSRPRCSSLGATSRSGPAGEYRSVPRHLPPAWRTGRNGITSMTVRTCPPLRRRPTAWRSWRTGESVRRVQPPVGRPDPNRGRRGRHHSAAVASISIISSGKARRATPSSVPGGATPAAESRSAIRPWLAKNRSTSVV